MGIQKHVFVARYHLRDVIDVTDKLFVEVYCLCS